MSAAPSLHEFGRFRLDSAERLLLRSGQPVSLTPKAFDLLVYLVERHGRLVTKQELMRALWSETFVEEANLTYTVSALRKALGEREGQDGEQLIQTVQTRGYRFVALVTHHEELPVSSPPVDRSGGGGDGQVAAVAPRRTRERLAWIGAAVFGVVACAMIVLYLRAVPPAPDPLEFPIAPPENWVFNARTTAPTFQIAPDGQHLAVVASSEGVAMLWVRPIAKPAWRQLPETQGADGPFWSPDSQSLGFFANDQLKTVRVSGGAPVVICEARVGQVPGGAWSHNGVILFGGLGPLRKVGVNPGNSTPVATLGPGEIAHRWPSFLPDGEHFLYLAEAYGRSELRVGSVASTDTTSLGPYESHAVYASGYLLFVRSGRLMAQPFDTDSRQLNGDPRVVAEPTAILVASYRGQFSVSRTGVLAYSSVGRPKSRPTWIDRTGKTVGTAGEPGFYWLSRLSPDDRLLAVSQWKVEPGGHSNSDIWVIDLARAGTATRLTFDAARDHDPAWSPDGTQIAFVSNRIGDRFSLFRRAANGSGGDKLLVKSDTNITSPDWSLDGQFLLYTDEGGARFVDAASFGRSQAESLSGDTILRRPGQILAGRPLDRLHVERVGPQRGLRAPVSCRRGTLQDLARWRTRPRNGVTTAGNCSS